MAVNGWLGGENESMGSQQRQTRWLTPKPFVEALGRFDLDPCGAPGWDLADRTYLLENGDDGLRDPWFGRVWLNPPYGKELAPFLARMAEHRNGVALIFARTETKAWSEFVWPVAKAVLFLSRRMVFISADGVEAKANAGAPSALVCYSDEDVEAVRRSGLGGSLVTNWETLKG